MNFPDFLLPQGLLWPADIVAALLLGVSILKAPWARLRNGDIQHLWLACCTGLLLMWSIKAGIKPGLDLHLLGATALTLMFGPALALIAMAVVLMGVTIYGSAGWISLGINFLVMAAVPVVLSYVIYSQAHHKLPKHVFIYIFLDAFVAAWLAIALSGLVSTLVLVETGAYKASYLQSNYLAYFILMGWSEAMLTGMATTLMVVYRPNWLSTFNDKLYLNNK
ncbi:arsenic transporter [Novimethylophilus kurashikiensis]|uniref:Arsenic transporter n=1 Tax=Novimethylophilus kurashikiensis TaxID=1825523 RepID=A0A2R5FGQ3_9PROT|nr:energy-coupling factor ABC transporter permease [Novimethylophilus kurashikiensis]GBG15381.1 arsenic transporter [Novimethylophilus kurashikiensis]